MIYRTPLTFVWILALLTIAAPAQAQRASPSIVGGSDAQIEDFPFQVYVSAGQFVCGGTLRDSTHVITAAHCVIDPSRAQPGALAPSQLAVGFGDDDISDGGFPAGQTRSVASVALDRRYLRRMTGNEYDSAVLTLKEEISPNEIAQPLPLADATSQASFLEPGDDAVATGFGRTGESEPTSAILQAVTLPLVSDLFCGSGSRYGSEYVGSAMVCAGDTVAGGKDTCAGDSGGPLVVDTAATGDPPSYVLAGITSFGNGCGRAEFPGVYTQVTEPATRAFLSTPALGAPPEVDGLEPAVVGTPQVGSTVSCSPPDAEGATPFQYLFYAFNGATFTGLASGESPTLTVPASALGQRLNCDVRYENDAGFDYTDSTGFSGPVTAAPGLPRAPADNIRPRSRVTRVRCSNGTCVISLTASDTLPGSVGSLRVVLSFRRTVCRRRKGKRVCRPGKVRRKVLRAGALGRGRYRAIAFRLPPRRYRVSAVATDTAGNRQRKAASRTFRVRRQG